MDRGFLKLGEQDVEGVENMEMLIFSCQNNAIASQSFAGHMMKQSFALRF